jgi:hypothetical protein
MTITQELIDAERVKFEASAELKYLDFSKTKDAWGKEIYFYTHVEAMWQGWQAAISQHKAVQDGYVVSDDMKQVFKQGRPLEHSLDDYWRAPSGEGSLAAQWADKPHRLIYDLIAALIAAAPSDSKALVESEPVGYITKDGFDSLKEGIYGAAIFGKSRTHPIPVYTHPTPADTVKQDALRWQMARTLGIAVVNDKGNVTGAHFNEGADQRVDKEIATRGVA